MSQEWLPSDRRYLVDDLCRTFERASANEGWFRQSWLGVEIWQMPEDMIRLQAVVHAVKPRWIIETGTKFGGSAIFFSSLLSLCGETQKSEILTVDLKLHPETLNLFKTHPHGHRIHTALEGNAADPKIIDQFKTVINHDPGGVIVFLDDNHNAEHVYQELEGYAPLVSPGSYIIVADTVFADLAGTPVGQSTEKYPDVLRSNPRIAIDRFLDRNLEFSRAENPIPYGPSNFRDGFLKRI